MSVNFYETRPPGPGTIVETSVPRDLAFSCAVTASRGPRAHMEDTYIISVPFAGIHGQGLFGVFDGHGGKRAASLCSERYAGYLLTALRENRSETIGKALRHSFHLIDHELEERWIDSEGRHDRSGCTAVVAFLRLEDENKQQSFLPSNAVSSSHQGVYVGDPGLGAGADGIFVPPPNVRRVLYCANVGDARGVLCRSRKAIRLSHDHVASDNGEAARVEKTGGRIIAGRVDGHLIPTRALGDPAMNPYVSSTPHVVEARLSREDEFIILACDGLWDVLEDQEAVDLIYGVSDAAHAAQLLLQEARRRRTQDNVTVLVIRLQL